MILIHRNEKTKGDPIAFLHLELPPFAPSRDAIMLFNFLKFLDKRQYPRRFVNLPIQYHLPDKAVGGSGSTLNISEGGLAVELPDKLEVGQILRLNVYDKGEGIIGIFARVVWSDDRPYIFMTSAVDIPGSTSTFSRRISGTGSMCPPLIDEVVVEFATEIGLNAAGEEKDVRYSIPDWNFRLFG